MRFTVLAPPPSGCLFFCTHRIKYVGGGEGGHTHAAPRLAPLHVLSRPRRGQTLNVASMVEQYHMVLYNVSCMTGVCSTWLAGC